MNKSTVFLTLLLGLGLFAYFRPKPLPKELLEEAERRLKEPPR